jgi:hypothetical protein
MAKKKDDPLGTIQILVYIMISPILLITGLFKLIGMIGKKNH